ncbi:MAG: cyclic nucleotide-binding domain-containing protein [Desulforhopalus sp.]|nr:cyclic nucleotide-binding domain-containing protein [Desulforhopalus sp.]
MNRAIEESLEAVEERIRKYSDAEYSDADDEGGGGTDLYDEADHLKNSLLEVDPFTLDEEVKFGDLIDGQGARAGTPPQFGIWGKLGEVLTVEEFKVLCDKSSLESYGKGDILVKSGDMDRSLFLLNSGSVGLNCKSGGMERFLRRVSPGIILGGDQFFDASVWTVTLRALSPVEVQVVDQRAWEQIKKKCPQIREKLRSYCAKGVNISELVTLFGDDRRATSRYVLHTQTKHQFLNPAGKYSRRPNHIFKGELLDISRGGVAFSLKLSHHEKSREMLSQQILTGLETAHGFSVDYPGIVVGVRLFDSLSQRYSVHIKFAREIDHDEFMEILRSSLPKF